jgi:hypothetical protein
VLLVRVDGMKEPASSVEPHYSLREAVERFFPGGHITVRSLRTEIKKGRLRVVEVAGKFLVSESAIAQMLESCGLCRVPERPRASSYGAAAKIAVQSGTSATERIASARAAAELILPERKKRLPITSQ